MRGFKASMWSLTTQRRGTTGMTIVRDVAENAEDNRRVLLGTWLEKSSNDYYKFWLEFGSWPDYDNNLIINKQKYNKRDD